jgi:putative ABC transport system permease protein
MVLMRLIATERSEIGLLKAFGYGNLEVAWHYMKLVIAIAAVGIAAGSVLGAAFGLHNTRLYADFFRFPVLIYRPSPTAFVVAALVSIGTTSLGAIAAVRRAALLPPAEAMRPPQPIAYRRSRAAKLHLVDWFDQPTRIALRQIGRWPFRALLTTSGLAMSVGLLVMALQWTDMIDEMAQRYFYDTQRQSMMIGLSDPQATTAVAAFAHLPGVLAVEPLRIVGADFSVGTRKHRGAITGVRPDAVLQPVHDDATGVDVRVPPAGLVMSTRLAEKLGVGVGDRVFVEVQRGRRPSVELPVTRLFETLIAMPVYMDIDALNRLLEERPSLEYANLLVDRNAEPELFEKLKTLPRIGAIMVKRAAVDSFYETIGEQMLIYTGMFAMFAAALGFGVTYNSTRIALSERARELATLRVLGFTRGEISYILLAEVALLVVAALPLGCFAGYGLTRLIAWLLDTELFRIPVVIRPATYGYAVLLAIAAAALSAALVRRRIDHLDLIRVLKTRE